MQNNNPDSSNWLVIKLGGTSVSQAAYWQTLAGEIHSACAQGFRVLVVQSALSGVTDELDALLATAAAARQQRLTALFARHEQLAADMGIAPPADLYRHRAELDAALGERAPGSSTPPAIRAQVLACGELLASTLGAAFLTQAGLAVQWRDARDLLVADGLPGQTTPGCYLSAACHRQTDTYMRDQLHGTSQVVLTQGFIARNPAGETVLLGRGGSDTSAACFAESLQAERLEIWTDVPGLFSANPHQVPSARLLRLVDYAEAQEIASTGAKVLHPRCLEPVRRAGIPVAIRYTPQPSLLGTLITAESADSVTRVKAISVREHITLISMETPGMWHQVGFLADAFACFKRHGLSVDLVSTSETSVTVSLDPLANLVTAATLDVLLADLRTLCGAELLPDCTAISLVGRQIRANLHRLAPAFELFADHRVHLLSQAANDLNFTFVVDADDAPRLLRELHALLIQPLEGDTVLGPSWQELQAPLATGTTRPAYWWETRRDALLALTAQQDACFVYDLPSVRQAANALRQLPAVDRVLYSVKANHHPAILRTLQQAGLGFECVAPGEITQLQTHLPNLAAEDILFTPNFAPRGDYAAALAAGITVTLDNLHPLREWPELFANRAIFLRLDPGQGAGHHRHVRTAGEHSKFGIPLAELEEARSLAQQAGARVTGLHAHAGSGIFDTAIWRELGATLLQAAQRCPDVRVLNLGGGLGVPEKPGQPPLDLDALGQVLSDIKQAQPALSLWLEPGRFLVAAAGVLLARVTQLKGKGATRYVGVATGMNSLLRPALYGAHHPIVNLSRLEAPTDSTWNIVGPICETGDILGHERRLAEPREGDVLLIANAGAYGRVMGSHYNLRDPAPEQVLS